MGKRKGKKIKESQDSLKSKNVGYAANTDYSGAGRWIAQNVRVLFSFVLFEMLVLGIFEAVFNTPMKIERLSILAFPVLIVLLMRNLARDSAKPGLVAMYHTWTTILLLSTGGCIGFLYRGEEQGALLAYAIGSMLFLTGLSFYFWNWYLVNMLALVGVLVWALQDWFLIADNRPLVLQTVMLVFLSAIFCKSRVREFKEQVVQNTAWSEHKMELQAAVNSAKESTNRFQKIYDGSFEGIVLHKAGYIFDCNPALLDIFQISKDAIVNQNILTLLGHEGDTDLFNAFMIGQTRAREVSTVTKSGETLHLEMLSKLIHSEDGDIIATALRNVTERKLAEQELFDKNQALEKQFNRQKALAEWSTVLDKDHDIQSMSGIILRYLSELLPAEAGVFFGIRNHHNSSWRVFVARNGNIEPESWSSKKNTPFRDLAEKICRDKLTLTRAPEELGLQKRAFAALPLELSSGRQGFIMVQDMNLTQYTNQDIDFLIAVASRFSLGLENKKMVEDLVGAKEAAEAGSRAKSQFLATLSHELRTPLNGIIGSCQILEMTLQDDEDLSSLTTIRNSSEAMTNMVDRILSFTQIEGDKVALKSARFSIETLLSDVLDSLESLQSSKGLELDVEVSPDLPQYWDSDFHSCKTVILNLAENALKFTEEGGVKINVSASSSVDGQMDWLRFEISDTGCGFDNKELEKLFEPFSQGDGSHSRKYGGLGLGLAVCKSLTNRLGGRIGAQSDVSGSQFWFEIPNYIPSFSGDMDSGDIFTKIGSQSKSDQKEETKPESQPEVSQDDLDIPDIINPMNEIDDNSVEENFSKEDQQDLSKDEILVVESSPFIRMALMKHFEKLGVESKFVKDLQEAVAQFAMGNADGKKYYEVLISNKNTDSDIHSALNKVEKLNLSYNPIFKKMIRAKDGQSGSNGGLTLEIITPEKV